MRLFHVNQSHFAKSIAGYFISSRIPFQFSFTQQGVISPEARFTFKVPLHIATKQDELESFEVFLHREHISVVNDDILFNRG